MSSAINVGGVGVALSPLDVLDVAAGHAPITLDAAALARVKKESPAPEKFAAEDEATARAADAAALEGVAGGAHDRLEGAEPVPSPPLTPPEARAVVLARLLSLANGTTRVRADVLRLLGDGLLNGRVTPALPAGPGDGAPLAALAAAVSSGAGLVVGGGDGAAAPSSTTIGRALAASAPAAPSPTGLSAAERAALAGGKAAAAGVASLAVGAAARLAPLATAVAALTCEALRLDVGKALGGAGGGGGDAADGHPAAAAVRAEMAGLTTGSKAAAGAPRGPGGGPPPALAAVPSAHGALAAVLAPARAAARAELAVPATAAPGGGKGGEAAPPPPPALELASTQLALARALAAAAALSVARAVLLGGEAADGVAEARAALAAAREGVAAAAAGLDADPAAAPALPAARAAAAAAAALTAALGAEAAAALATARRLEAAETAPAPAAAEGDAAANGKGGGGGKGGGKAKGPPPFALGRGTALLALYLEGRLDAGGEDAGGGQAPAAGAAPPPTTTAAAAAALLHPAHPALPGAAAALRGAAEANAARRRPKLPKGTRDFGPDQMAIRKWAFGAITSVFERHGAVAIDTPVFELRETLTGKYGEDSKLIYDLADQGGEALSLRYDLTVPFARYAALHGVSAIKRYHVGKVYRRDQPAAARGRFREFFQCDFDIAGAYPAMVPDAEVIAVLVEVLAALGLGPVTIKLNHRGLLDAGLRAAGVPPAKFRTACSSVDKLDKEPWEAVRRELVERKGIAPGVADAVGAFVAQAGPPAGLVAALQASPLGADPGAAAALADLAVLASHLDALAVPAGAVSLDMSLARGLDYYTGVIFEAVLEGAAVGSIAAGGRYDGLVGMFSGVDVPAVGVSIGIERVFALVEARTRAEAAAVPGGGGKVREAETAVLVTSAGKGLQPARMALAAALWAAGVPAEFGYKANPNLGESLRTADAAGLPFVCVLGPAEVEKGVVKVRDMAAGSEEEVPIGEAPGRIAAALAASGPRGLVATGRAGGASGDGGGK